MYPRPMTGGFGINAGTGIVYPPAPSSGFEFGADDAQVAPFGAGITALPLLSPTKVRYTFPNSNDDENGLQLEDTVTTVPFPTGTLIIPTNFSGVLGFEAEFTLPDLSAASYDGRVAGIITVFDPIGSSISLLAFLDSGIWKAGDGGTNNFSLGTSGTFRVALDADLSDRDNVDVTIKSGNSTLSFTVAALANGSIPAAQVTTFVNDVGTANGLTLDIELIQDSADFTETHVAGAVALADALEVKA